MKSRSWRTLKNIAWLEWPVKWPWNALKHFNIKSVFQLSEFCWRLPCFCHFPARSLASCVSLAQNRCEKGFKFLISPQKLFPAKTGSHQADDYSFSGLHSPRIFQLPIVLCFWNRLRLGYRMCVWISFDLHLLVLSRMQRRMQSIHDCQRNWDWGTGFGIRRTSSWRRKRRRDRVEPSRSRRKDQALRNFQISLATADATHVDICRLIKYLFSRFRKHCNKRQWLLELYPMLLVTWQHLLKMQEIASITLETSTPINWNLPQLCYGFAFV